MKTMFLTLAILFCVSFFGVGCEKENNEEISAPTNFLAQIVYPHENGVLLHWEDNAVNEDGYKIYRIYDGNKSLVKIVDANATRATDTVQGNDCLQTKYEIFAFNASGHSNKVKTKLIGVGCQ